MTEKKRMNATTREAFVILYAVHMALKHVEPHMERLTKRVPFGWRNFRLAEVMLEKCVDQVMDTIPVEQLRTIMHQMAVSEFRICSKAVGGAANDNIWAIDKQTLTDLASYAVNGECVLCDKKDPKCRLRKLLADIPVDIHQSSMMPCGGIEED